MKKNKAEKTSCGYFKPEIRGYMVDLNTGKTLSPEFPTLTDLEKACRENGLGLSVELRGRMTVANVLPPVAE